MKIIEIGTGYTSIPAKMGAATEIVVEELTRAMLQQNQDVIILDIKDKNRMKSELPIEEVYMPQFFSTGAVVKLGVFHKVKRVLYSLSLAIKLRKIIMRSNEHLYLHFHNQYNLYFFLKLCSDKIRQKVTIGYTVHSYIWFGKWDDIKDTIRKRYFQEIYCCQKADRLFVLNDIVAKMLTEHYQVNPENIIQVINGVNTNVYNENVVDKKTLESLRDRYGLKDKKVIFQVGSVCDRKNQLGSLELLLPIMKRDTSIAFAYAGGIIDEAYALSIYEKAKAHGVADRVVYFGEVAPGATLNQLYALADVCLMNSKSEAFALVIAEALSVPRPIFINETIMQSLIFLADNLGNGIIKIDDDFENNVLQILMNNSFASELKQKGRAFIEREYSWKVAAKMYVDAFASKQYSNTKVLVDTENDI